MTLDEIHTKAVEALGFLGQSDDEFVREEFLHGLLIVVYQDGRIDANHDVIKRNAQRLMALKEKLHGT